MPLSSGVELHVPNFLGEHEGNYSCTATNPLGQVTGSVHLVPVYDLGVSKKKHMSSHHYYKWGRNKNTLPSTKSAAIQGKECAVASSPPTIC